MGEATEFLILVSAQSEVIWDANMMGIALYERGDKLFSILLGLIIRGRNIKFKTKIKA